MPWQTNPFVMLDARTKRVIVTGSLLLACGSGCARAHPESAVITIPAVERQSRVAHEPIAAAEFSFGERQLIEHRDVPAFTISCDEKRVAWMNVRGEVFTYGFGDASPRQLPNTNGSGAVALSGDDLFAVVEGDSRWSVVEYRGNAWSAVADDLAIPSRNLAADAQHVVWVGRDGSDDALFVLDRQSGRITPRSLGTTHWFVKRIALDRGHAFVLAEDSMHTPQLYDADLTRPGMGPLPASQLEDIGAAGGVLIGLQSSGERARSDLMVIAGAPRRPLARFVTDFHPSVVVGGGVGCVFSSDEQRHATVDCVDLATGMRRIADTFLSNWEFLAMCGGKHLVWTRPTAERKGWDLVYSDLVR